MPTANQFLIRTYSPCCPSIFQQIFLNFSLQCVTTFVPYRMYEILFVINFYFQQLHLSIRPSGAWKQFHRDGRNWLLEGSFHVQQNKIAQLEKTRCSWQRESVTASESSKRFTSLCSNLGTIPSGDNIRKYLL